MSFSPSPAPPSSSSSTAAAAASSDTSSSDEASEGIVLFLSVSVLVGCFCRWLVRRFDRVPLPFTVLLLLVGVLMGAIAEYGGIENNVFQDAIVAYTNLSPQLALYLFLPVLIFDSAFNVHFHLFMHSLWAALLLAFPGALICLFFAAVCARYVFDYGWSWSESLMLGSVLASTDPVAVVALLRELGSSHELATLIEGESLLNDGSAFVVYLLMQSILLGGDSSASHLVSNLFQYSLGGPAFGLAFGMATVLVLELFVFRDAELEITLTIAAVYVCFWVADSPLNVSAVLAIVVMGLVMAKNRYAISPSVQPALRAVWDVLIFFTNILIFVLSGLIIADKLFGDRQFIRPIDVGWLFLLYVVLHVVRFLSIVLFLPLFRRTNVHLNMREVLMISWSGMRGGVSLILALITYLQPAYDESFRSRLTFLVSGIVLLTLVVNGMASRYVLRFLKLNKGTEESRLILNSALLHMRQQTAHAMRGMKDDPKFSEVKWQVIRPFLPQKLIEQVKQETEQNQPDTPYNDSQPTDTREAGGERVTAAAAAASGMDEPEQLDRRASTSRRSRSERRGKLRVTIDESDDEKGSEVGGDERHMQEMLFPPDHPIHRIQAQQRLHEQRMSAEPGDVTLLMMPTVMYERVMGPLPDEKESRQDDEKDEVGALPLPSPRQPYSSSVREQLRPPTARRLPSAISRRTHRQPTASALMAIFDDPTDTTDDGNVALPAKSPAVSPSRVSLETAIPLSPTDPPPGPSVPPVPGPPLAAPEPSSPHIWQHNSSPHLPRPLQPSRSRRRQLLHHRQLSSMGESRMWPAPSGLSGRKLSLLRELSVRFMTAMQADYARQFSSGLLSRQALRILTSASEKAIDSGSILSHWTSLRQQLRCPPWLSFLYSSSYLLSGSDSDVPWYIRSFRSAVQHLMFTHLKVSVELTTAFLSSSQRLETVLDAFPELSAIDADAVDVVQRQVGYLQHKALAAWVDVCEGYGEAHSAVVTRHAAIMLLHFQQREIRSLHSTGMLEQREFDLILALINAKLVRLDQRGLPMHMSSAVQLLSAHPLLHSITEDGKRRLRGLIRDKRTRRCYSTHQPVWEKGQHCPGLILTVRGTIRLEYQYDTQADEHDNEHTQHTQHTQHTADDSKQQPTDDRRKHVWHHQLPRSLAAALAGLLARSTSSSHISATEYPAPTPTPTRTAARVQHSTVTSTNTNTNGSTNGSPPRLLDTKARLSVVGAYEMLTGHSTVASCRTVTMAESFLLDSECVDVLMDEDEAMQCMVRWAADDILKAKWRQWHMHTATQLKHYHIPELLKRAQVFRSKLSTTTQQHTLSHSTHNTNQTNNDVELDHTQHANKQRHEHKQKAEAEHSDSDSDRDSEKRVAPVQAASVQSEPESKSQSQSQSQSQAQSQVHAQSPGHAQVQAQSPAQSPAQPPAPAQSPAQPSVRTPPRPPSPLSSTSPSPSQHRISLRYNDVLLIIDGSAVGCGMTRRVKRSAAQQYQPYDQQHTGPHTGPHTRQAQHTLGSMVASTALAPHSPARAPFPPSTVPPHTLSVARAPLDPPSRPRPSRPSSPLYLGPCMLRQRQGELCMSANCYYVRWELRDEDIASLFPPPPRADMRQYARELGLQLRMSAAVSDGRDKADMSDIRQPSLDQQPSFLSPASLVPHTAATDSASSASSLLSAATNAGTALTAPDMQLSAASTLSKLPSSSLTYGERAVSGGLTMRAPLLDRPIALSELASPRLTHYLGATAVHNTVHSHTPATAQYQHFPPQRQQRRYSLNPTTEPALNQQRQRRASTAAAAHSPNHYHHNDNEQQAVDGQADVVEEEEEWDPRYDGSESHAQQRGVASTGQQPRRVFAFDIEAANSLTI